MSVKEKMTAIADSIREKTGKAKPLTLDDMASAVPEVYQSGQTDFINMLFWNGERIYNRYLFNYCDFSGYTFNPTVYPKGAGYMFYSYQGKELPKGLDFSNVEYDLTTPDDAGLFPSMMFYNASLIKEIPDMNIPPAKGMQSFAAHCSALEKIEKIRVAEITDFSNAFFRCDKLTYIRFEGVIGKNISFQYSPLDVDSLKDVITHLKNYAGTDNEYAYTVTFKSTAFSALTAEGATSPNGNAWAEYIDDLKWNLTLA